ncbi:nitrate- and nitrite sensing domain-containing protein [Solwaraspora sp. WMMD1047]|uniref:sensor histidine kinase n=1 Tax=Solwaraspora sp. WMMD1047 TaxID=3016102 RepID=UPI002415EC55|nr:nitrate- and nitrite sensing domain-containing protein [Solwaraspora sp. WMMD1047]MDG4831765.1 nitrate- and nitrite sensing domain-containing protein [Solwaraspora sp. WMMD1047]
MDAAPDPSHGAVSRHRRRRLDVRVVPHRRRSPLRPRDWRIGTKLGAVLVVPSLAFLVLAGAQTATLFGQADLLGDFSDQVGVAGHVSVLVHELQNERDRTAGELAALGAGGGEPSQAVTALRPAHDAVDRALAEFRRAAQPLADTDASWRISYSRAEELLAELPEVRAALPAAVLNANAVLSNYNRAIESLLTLLAEPSPGADEPELTDAVLRHVQFARVKETASRIRGQLYAAARAGQYAPDDLVELTDLRAQQLTALADFRASATEIQVRRLDQLSTTPDFVAATQLEQGTVASGEAAPVVLDAGPWWAASEQRQELLRQVETTVLADAIDQAENRSTGQLNRTILTAGAVLAVLLIALVGSIVVARSLARSLRVLRGQALQVAQIELPEALERLRTVRTGVAEIEVSPALVRSMDEIGEVAEAFVAVHRSAVSVAVEQAVMRRNVNAMFVNLARRSQVLVERQLELLDELERDEGDPDQLENLFKLDHLAARMRRNDDSLLVLAGTEANRRWSRPVSLSTVMLAAVAEIEQYQRVRHQVDDHLHIVGHAVADLVHLLAELLENATAFSRPDTSVLLSGRAHSAGSAVIEICDEGLGMSTAALDEANALLAEPAVADVAASERMGLFVVSHLAARQQIQVQLRPAERGLVAVIWLPTTVLAPPPAPAEDPADPSPRRLTAATGAVADGTGPDLSAAAAGPGVSGGAAAGGLSGAAASGLSGGVAWRVSGAAAGDFSGAAAGDVGLGVGVGNGAVPVGLPALPVAGRPPAPAPAQRTPPRQVPTRAEDVLATATGMTPTTTGSTWWSRPGQGRPTVPAPLLPATPAPPAVPVTGGIKPSGLPARVPMAQLPGAQAAPPSATPLPPEPDPDAVGGMLSRFYGGVRRAEAEETIVMPMAPAGARSEEEQP